MAAWGNALGGYKRQRRNKKGQFAGGRGGAIGRSYRKGKSANKAYKKRAKAQKARSRSARKAFVRDAYGNKSTAVGIAAQVAVGAAGVYATSRAFQGSNRGGRLPRQPRGTSAARKAGVAPMNGWNPGYKNGGRFNY